MMKQMCLQIKTNIICCVYKNCNMYYILWQKVKMQRTDINDSIQYSANFISWKGTERFLRVYWVLYSFYQIKFLTPFGKDSCKSSKDASISLALAFNLEILCWEKCQKNFVKVNNYIEWRKRKKSWLPHLYFSIFCEVHFAEKWNFLFQVFYPAKAVSGLLGFTNSIRHVLLTQSMLVNFNVKL